MAKASWILPLRENQENLAKFEVLEEWLQAPFVTTGWRLKIAKELFMLGWQEGA